MKVTPKPAQTLGRLSNQDQESGGPIGTVVETQKSVDVFHSTQGGDSLQKWGNGATLTAKADRRKGKNIEKGIIEIKQL